MKKLPSTQSLAKTPKSKRSYIDDDGEVMELDAAWFRTAKIAGSTPRKSISLRLDPEVLAWYRSQGKGYQTRMQAVLAAYAKSHTKRGKA